MQSNHTTVYLYDGSRTEVLDVVETRSTAGYSAGPEYRVSYRLADGGWLNATRHADRGDLHTDIGRNARATVAK